MPPASVNTISRASQAAAAAPASQIDANPNSFNLRDFVVDEEAANFTNALWKSIDQTAFVMAQREALEAFNVAKALRLSEKTAAVEHQRRTAAAASSSASTSASAHASTSASASVSENKPGPSSSASDFARQKSTSASSSLHERKPSSSASTAAQQSSQPRLLLSTQSSYSLDNTASTPSRAANSVSSSSSASQSHASQSHRMEHRSLSKRELESPVTKLSISMSPYSSSAPTSASSSASASASASSSSSRTQISDVTNTKRRRTERQPSTSPNMPSATQQYYQQQQQQQQLVAPAIVVPKKSTGPTRDVRPVQTTNLKENHASIPPTPVELRSRRRSIVNPSQPSRKTTAAPEPRDTFTATRSCTKCGTPVLSPRGQPSTETLDIIPLLHLTCTKCQTTHCRGCFAPARCNRALVLASSSSRSPPTSAVSSAPCDGGSTCTVRTCCAAVRAIAIFEVLSWFDEIYAIEADFGGSSHKSASSSDKGKSRDTKEQRDAYVRMLISKTDVVSASKAENMKAQAERGGSTRRFEDAFVRTLKLLCAWLQVPDREDDDDRTATAEDKDREATHASVPRLFMSSMLLEVVHVFLGNTNVRDWVAHAETYLAILDLLRRMLDVSSSSNPFSDTSSFTAATSSAPSAPASWADSVTLTTILRTPMRRIESNSGLRRAVWGDANVRYEDLSASGFASAVAAEGSSSRHSLCDLVQHLEAHRRPLMALAAKITFVATVEKVNNLCDGISYLLLQQVVGGI